MKHLAILFFSIGLSFSGFRAAGAAEPDMEPIRALIREGRFLEAEGDLRRLIQAAETEHGPRSLELARVLDLFVDARLKSGKAGHSETLDMARRALAIKESLPGLDPAELSASLHNLALVQRTSSHSSAGNRHYRYLVAEREKDLGPDNPDVASALEALALSLLDLGDPREAVPILEKALSIRRKAPAPSIPMARTLCLSALTHLRLGDDMSARSDYLAAISIYESALAPDDPRLAVVLADWARQLIDEEVFHEAGPLLERALHIWRGNVAPADAFTARCEAGLGMIHLREGNLEPARKLLQGSLAVLESHPDAEARELATLQSSLAGVLEQLGNAAEAGDLYERSALLYQESEGSGAPEAVRSLVQFARTLARSGRRDEALRNALRAQEMSLASLRLVALALPEQRALEMAPIHPSALDMVLTLAMDGLPAGSRQSVHDALIRNRALVLDEVAARHHTVREVDSPGTARLFDAFAAANREYAREFVKGAERGGQKDTGELERRRREREEAEAALSARSLVFRRARVRSQAGYSEVTAALPPGSVLVSYACFDRDVSPGSVPSDLSRSATPCYLAFVASPGGKPPAVIPLGDAAEIERLVRDWGREAGVEPLVETAPSEDRCRKAGEALRERVWDPVSRMIRAGRVFIVPDGALHQVSFQALPAASGGYLVEEGPLIHYLSAERDLVSADVAGPRGEDLLVLGEVDFEPPPKPESPHGSPAKPEDRSSWSSPRPFRGSRPRCETFETMRFEPLPASGREMEDILAIWRAAQTSASTLKLSGAEATEAAFKESAGGRRILHLATHGFVLGGDCLSGRPGTRGIGTLSPETSGPPGGPLQLSGLALAGANARASVGPDEEDGVLTAEEIAALDLSGVQWAVLSACDTGLGQIRSGEGVFGLRRAFEVAGVETLIMSLWAVEDETGGRWMRELYRARLVDGMDTAASFRQACLGVLEERRKNGESTHPFFWGGFVAAGEWR